MDRMGQGQENVTVVSQRHRRGAAVTDATNEIGIVLYPGVQAACVHGLTDLFCVAASIALDQQRDGRSSLRVTHWQPAYNRDTNLSCVYDSDPRGSPQPRILIIPPTMVDLPDPEVPTGVVSWLRSHYACGAKLVSVCSGAFILAETGLVAGRSVSTHRICAEALAERFPQVTVDTNQRIIDDGDIMTAGGFLAWVDVGLLLVDRLLGAAVRAETGRFILSDPAASEARYFPGFAPSRLRKKSRWRAICRAPMRNTRLSCREFVTETGFCVDFDAFYCRWADSGQSPAVTTPRHRPAWSGGRDCRPWR
jgi:transcriptional regulator GlxA family with amidase domain